MLAFHNVTGQTQEYDELIKKQRDEGVEKNFKKMRWPCRSCELSDDPRRSQNFKKPLHCFNVRSPSDFVNKLLPQGQWTRCTICQDKKKGELGKKTGGDTHNISKEERKEFGKLGGMTNNTQIKSAASPLHRRAKSASSAAGLSPEQISGPWIGAIG